MTCLTETVMYGTPKDDAETMAQIRRGLFALAVILEAADEHCHRIRIAAAALDNLRGRPDVDERLLRLHVAVSRSMTEAQTYDPRQPPREVTQ